MLPNVAEVLIDWEQAVTLKTVTRVTVDYVSADTVASSSETMVVQPADPKKLVGDNIDWALRHLMFHSRAPVALGQFIEYQSRDYKIIQSRNYADYGYTEAIGVETQRALL